MSTSSTDRRSPSPSAPAAIRSGPRTWTALVALSLAFGLVQLDATVVTVVLSSVRADLGGDLGLGQWLVDGYVVPFAAVMLSAGALGDRIGHRRTCILGFALFGASSVAAALSGAWAPLIAARALQGVGAALLLPSSLALIRRLFPDPVVRSRALGVWGGIATTGFAVGPAIGGLLATHAGWPAVFWINVPIAVVLAVVIAVLTPADRPVHRPFDRAGAVLGIAAPAVLTGGIISAGRRDAVTAAVLLAVGVLLVVAFVRTERAHPTPLIPRTLAAVRAFRWAVLTGFAFNFVLYGLLLVVTLVLTSDYGATAVGAGMAVLPMAVVVCLGATTSGFVAARLGPRRPMIAGFSLAAVGGTLLAVAGGQHSILWLVAGVTVVGLLSLAMPAMTSVALGAAPEADAGVAAGVLNSSRQLGGAVGVAVLGALLNAGGDRTGFVLATLLTVAVCVAGVATSTAATGSARPRADRMDPDRTA